MAYKRKSWQEKLHNGKSYHVEKIDKKFADIPADASMLVATPEIVDSYIRNIPFGSATTLQQMRSDLAAEYNAEYCCPITAGIFLRIAAEAAFEELTNGKSPDEVTPFWRIIDRKSPTAKKLSFGTEFIEHQRAAEGLPA